MRGIVLMFWWVHVFERWRSSDGLRVWSLFISILIDYLKQIVPVLIVQISFRFLMGAIFTNIKPLSDCLLNALKSLPLDWFAGFVLNNLGEVVLGDLRWECSMIESAVLVLSVISIIMVHELLPKVEVVESRASIQPRLGGLSEHINETFLVIVVIFTFNASQVVFRCSSLVG